MASALLKLGGLVLALVLSLTVAVRALRPDLPPLDENLHTLVGRVMAEETAAMLGEQADLVLLAPKAAFEMPLVEAQLRGFQKKLGAYRGMRIVAREYVQLDRVGPLDGLLTPALYFELAERHAGAGALVTFVGLGDFRDADLARVKPGMPPLYALSPNAGVPAKLVDRRLVGMAVVPRPSATSAATTPGREAFDRAYAVVGTGGRP